VLWSNRLRALNRPELHLYDRNVPPPAPPAPLAAMNQVNARNGCSAVATSKREIENYIHFEALNLARADAGIPVTFNAQFADFDDVPLLLTQQVNPHVPDSNKWGFGRAKEFISNVALLHMTKAMLDEVDANGEVVGWFRTMQNMIQTNN
jgi:putative ATP-dependent endonuclease of OLD family